MYQIYDFSNLAISSIQKSKEINLQKSEMKLIILNSLRKYILKFKSQYPEIIIATDSQNYWRRNFFPYYKIKRKSSREKSLLNWNLIFETLSELKSEIKSIFPYKLLEIHTAEADDIIGTLAPILNQNPIIIISSDGDYKQLQKYPNIKQFSPQLDAFVTTDNPTLWLKTKIIKGDPKDSIPSCISPDSIIAEGIRQKPVTQKILNNYLAQSDIQEPFYLRNKTLLDFQEIPIKNEIIQEFNIPQTGNKQLMLQYFIQNNLTPLIESLDEF